MKTCSKLINGSCRIMLPVGGMSTPQTPHPRTNSYNIYTPPNTALITNSAKPSSTSSENYTTLIPTQNDTNSGNQNIVPHSPHRRSIFMVHKHESPAHGKVNYHQGFHWRGKWWNRAQGSTGYGSDESQDEDGVSMVIITSLLLFLSSTELE